MLKHYRGDTLKQPLIPSKGTLKRSLMGPFLLEIEAKTTDVYTGDTLEADGQLFEIREVNGKKTKAEHITYKLVNYALIDKYFNTPPTYDDVFEFTDITLTEVLTLIEPLLDDAGLTLHNNSTSGSRMDVDFSGDNLLSALQKTCEVFEVEFKVDGTAVYIQDQVGIEKDITLYAGINTKDIEKKINKSNICTRIYPVGSSENLPESYYYGKLRPTTFDMTTETHSGNLNIDNDTGINTYGIIEKIVDFPDIKVKSRRGTVSGVGSDALPDKNDIEYPYIYDTNLSDIDEEKVTSSTLFFSNGLKAAEELRIVKASAEERKIWYSTRLKSGEELDWNPQAGDTYILVGYITQVEMNAARDKLIDEADKYLEENSAPKVEYTVKSFYAGGLSDKVEIGDTLRLSDSEAGIDTSVRILEYTKDILTGEYTSLKFGNTIEKIPIEILQEQVRQKAELNTVKQRLSGSEQTARQALERHNLLVNTGFYGDEKEEYALIGSKDRNYVLKGVEIDPDNPTAGTVRWTSGQFQRIGTDVPYTLGAGEQILTVGTWYLYIRLKEDDPLNSTGNNTLVFSSAALRDGTFKYYPLGMAEYVSGQPIKIATSYGFTLIDGNYIKTGTIEADRLKIGDISSSYLDTSVNASLSNADEAMALASDIVSDNRITNDERTELDRMWTQIVSTKSELDTETDILSLTTSTQKTEYDSAYGNLNTALNSTTYNGKTILGSTGIVELNAGVRDTVTGTISTYYAKEKALNTLINDALKALSDAAQSTADGAQSTADGAQTAAGNAQSTADTALVNAQTAQATADDAVSDLKITDAERKDLQRLWNEIVEEAGKLGTDCAAYSLTGETEYTQWTTSYNNLNTALNTTQYSSKTILGSSGVVTLTADEKDDLDGTGGYFETYFQKRQAIVSLINAAIYTEAENAQTAAGNAQSTADGAQTAANNAQSAADDAASNATTALNNVEAMGSDNQITPIEKLMLKRELENIQAEYTKYSEPFLDGYQGVEWDTSSAVTALDGIADTATSEYGQIVQNVFASYSTRYSDLELFLSPILETLTVTSTVSGTTLREKFAEYYSARGLFLNKLGNEARAGSAIELGVDDEGNGRIIIRESISGDTAKERYWKLGKDGMSYNVVDADGVGFSLNGGKILSNDVVHFEAPADSDVSTNPGAGVDVFIQNLGGKKIGFDPHKIKCITTYAGLTLLPNNDPITTGTYSEPIVEDGLVVGHKVYGLQSNAITPFDVSHAATLSSGVWTEYADITANALSPAITFSLYFNSQKPSEASKGRNYINTLRTSPGDNLIKRFVLEVRLHDSFEFDARASFYDINNSLIDTVTLFTNFVGHSTGQMSVNNRVNGDNHFIHSATYIDSDINVTTIYS